MLRAGRYIRLSLAIAAAIVGVDGFVLHGRANAEKVPLKDAIQGLEPQDVWQNFYDVTQVPRSSHHEEKIRSFLVMSLRPFSVISPTSPVQNQPSSVKIPLFASSFL